MRLGVVVLPEEPWRLAREKWQRAESLGFDHAWTYDHVAWRKLRNAPWHAAIPTLAAAAIVTNSLRLGPLVASPNLRHPVMLAKELKTLDDICAGRLSVGVGAGGYGWDATVFGRDELSTRDRADRFREFVELLDLLLRNRQCSYDGRWYTAREARAVPDCVQQPRVPVAVAEGDVQPGMDGATHADGLARQIRRLDHICEEVGRDPATLARMVVTGPLIDPGLHSPDAFRETIERYEALGFTDVVVHWPRTEEPYAGNERTFEKIIMNW